MFKALIVSDKYGNIGEIEMLQFGTRHNEYIDDENRVYYQSDFVLADDLEYQVATLQNNIKRDTEALEVIKRYLDEEIANLEGQCQNEIN